VERAIRDKGNTSGYVEKLNLRNSEMIRTILHKAVKKFRSFCFRIYGHFYSVFIKKDGCNIIGYFEYSFGSAQVAHDIIDVLLNKNAKFALYYILINSHKKLPFNEVRYLQKYYSSFFPYNSNLFLIDVEMIPHIKRRRPDIFMHRKNSVVFWWEFEDGHESRFDYLDGISDIIVYSKFIYDACKNVLPSGKVLTLKKYPFRKNWEIIYTRDEVREKHGISKDTFVFFFNFDYLSSFNRKNPIGLVTALHMLKESGLVTFRCIIKTSNADQVPDKCAQLNNTIEACGLGDHCILIDRIMVKDELMSLMNACDCYVSLHRGEGLGLGMMEAKSMGLPVVATGYGGNVDFMQGEPDCYLVNYTIVRANDDYYPYRFVTKWAEPDYHHAFTIMQKVMIDKLPVISNNDRLQ
jgi:glycosyltransferase involved in cell wall biosynthesis